MNHLYFRDCSKGIKKKDHSKAFILKMTSFKQQAELLTKNCRKHGYEDANAQKKQ